MAALIGQGAAPILFRIFITNDASIPYIKVSPSRKVERRGEYSRNTNKSPNN